MTKARKKVRRQKLAGPEAGAAMADRAAIPQSAIRNPQSRPQPEGTFGAILDQAKGAAPANPTEGMTVNQLADVSGSDRRSILKWLKQDGVQPTGRARLGQHDSDIYDREKAFACIASHQGGNAASHSPKGAAAVDPVTGLTWFQAHLREQTLDRRRENEIAEGLRNETYMLTSVHHQVLAIIANALEQLPGKMKSELGLTATQAARARKMLDETRQAAAGAVTALATAAAPHTPEPEAKAA